MVSCSWMTLKILLEKLLETLKAWIFEVQPILVMSQPVKEGKANNLFPIIRNTSIHSPSFESFMVNKLYDLY